jgi:uncharacterized protein
MDPTRYTGFAGERLLAAGALAEVALAVKAAEIRGDARVLVFDDATGAQVELDLRGDDEAVLARYQATAEEPTAARARGRPRLGVTAREVTLLPRHWEWLAQQPSGGSAALRRLVEQAMRSGGEVEAARRASEAAYRVMNALAGHLPHFEDGLRAFYAGDHARFGQIVDNWPPDVADYVRRMAAPAQEPG